VILWRGDADARRAATPQNNRFHHIFDELAGTGIDAEPAVYEEAFVPKQAPAAIARPALQRCQTARKRRRLGRQER